MFGRMQSLAHKQVRNIASQSSIYSQGHTDNSQSAEVASGTTLSFEPSSDSDDKVKSHAVWNRTSVLLTMDISFHANQVKYSIQISLEYSNIS